MNGISVGGERILRDKEDGSMPHTNIHTYIHRKAAQ
jgi:hypothetical protein